MAQAKLDNSGIKARPCRPGAAHDAVHQECRARHVAEVFQEQDEQEQDQDLRQEDDDAADARDDAVLQEALQQALGQPLVHQRAECCEAGRYQLHQRLRPSEDRLEHHEQQAQQDDQTEHRVQQHGIEPRGQRVRFCRHADRDFDDAVGLALGGAQFADGRRPPTGFVGRLQVVRRQCVEAEQQFIDAAAAHGGRGDDRHAELGRHAVEIDVDAAPRWRCRSC